MTANLHVEPPMSLIAESAPPPAVMDPYEIGWYIESADEDIYGPVSRPTIRRFLEEKVITPNTLVRHSTQPEFRPVADQPNMMEGLALDARAAIGVDRLADAWPRRWREQVELAGSSLPCAWHKRQAVLVCARCHAPYCNRCRAKPFKKQFFLCRRCQTAMYNRRTFALFIDFFCFLYFPIVIIAIVIALAGFGEAAAPFVNVVQLVGFILIFLRDALFRGAGPGKRVLGLRVVSTKDGRTPLTYGQGVLRWLSQLIPFYNLFDLSVPFRDPLVRRFGDRWAGTRVIDSEHKLHKVRWKIARRLIRKGIKPAEEFGMTMERFAQIA